MNENIILERIIEDANKQAKNIIDEANQEIEKLKNSLNEYDKKLNQNTKYPTIFVIFARYIHKY